VDRLAIIDVSAELIREFLSEIERSRGCSVATRNQRLAAIHALARFVGEHSPEHIDWCIQVRCVPYKKTTHAVVRYLDTPEIDALLDCPDRRTAQGCRDYALLLFLYNSGARASEAAQLTVGDIDLMSGSVSILGKGRKQRQCPLWPETVCELNTLIAKRPAQERVFLNRCGLPLTRFGIHAVVERCALKAQVKQPSLTSKHVSPHSIRHSTATHLLRAGVDINTVRAWLGHVSVDTTNIYAEIDLETKAKALDKCDVTEKHKTNRRWANDPELMAFLHSL
jgi:site-specific recombinase XerD